MRVSCLAPIVTARLELRSPDPHGDLDELLAIFNDPYGWWYSATKEHVNLFLYDEEIVLDWSRSRVTVRAKSRLSVSGGVGAIVYVAMIPGRATVTAALTPAGAGRVFGPYRATVTMQR